MQIVNLVAVVANNQSTVNQSVGKSTQCLAKILKKCNFGKLHYLPQELKSKINIFKKKIQMDESPQHIFY